jgi:hypothetical protein
MEYIGNKFIIDFIETQLVGSKLPLVASFLLPVKIKKLSDLVKYATIVNINKFYYLVFAAI